jgi:hypothetical protein
MQPRTAPYGDAGEALQDAAQSWHPWWSRHWADVLVIAGGLILVARFVFVAMGAWQRQPRPEVRARFDLPAFTVLRPEHLARDSGVADAAARRVEGRYLLRGVRARSPIHADALGPATLIPALLAGRSALPLLVAPGAAPDSLRAGMVASLVVSPAEGGASESGLIIDRVPVLSATAQAAGGTRVVVAVTRAQLQSLAPRLGSARVFVLTP